MCTYKLLPHALLLSLTKPLLLWRCPPETFCKRMGKTLHQYNEKDEINVPMALSVFRDGCINTIVLPKNPMQNGGSPVLRVHYHTTSSDFQFCSLQLYPFRLTMPATPFPTPKVADCYFFSFCCWTVRFRWYLGALFMTHLTVYDWRSWGKNEVEWIRMAETRQVEVQPAEVYSDLVQA